MVCKFVPQKSATEPNTKTVSIPLKNKLICQKPKKSMINSSNYIVQFVGFKTTLTEIDFIRRWAPFASNFKSQGILTIDLYKVVDKEDLNYISRNIWEEKTYFQNFPTGVAGSGSGGGISVTQFGGYRIPPDQLESPKEMELIFLHDIVQIDDEIAFSCLGSTDKVPFKQVLIANDDAKSTSQINSVKIKCAHLKQI
jgi:hypothetical protein